MYYIYIPRHGFYLQHFAKQMTNATKATKAELHMYRNWKAQLQLELKNRVKAANNKLIEESKKALAQLEENFKDINVGQDNRSFFYHNNGKTYHYPTRFTSDSEADRKCRIKYQGLFVQHYEMFSLLSESKDEEWLELQARYYSAREPHFTGFDGDGYRNPAENK